MMNPRYATRVAAVVSYAQVVAFVVLGCPLAAVAQGTATLRVTVVDQSDATVSNATITLTNTETMLQRQLPTSDAGEVSFPLLPSGRYMVRAEHVGFTPAEVSNVTLADDANTALRLQLKVEGLTESVVVTAQKRGEERVQEVPIALSVTSPELLSESRKVLLRDYYMEVPNLSAGPRLGGGQGVAIRGITTGGLGAPTVGFLIDGAPFGTSGNYGGGLLPDIEPSDLERMEVLRGPQGVLYGSSAMGGLINYVTKKPDFSRLSGSVEAGTSTIADGGAGYNVTGAVNIPIGNRFAIRASGFTRLDAGYIDNPRTTEDDLNDADAGGFRAAALWEPHRSFSFRLNALYQRTKTNGSSDVVVRSGLRDLEQDLIANSGITEREVQAYSASLRLQRSAFVLTYDGAFSSFAYDSQWDASANATFGAAAAEAFGERSALYNLRFPFDKWTHELRLSMKPSDRFDVFVGGFSTQEDAVQSRVLYGTEAASGVIRGVLGTTAGPTSGFDEHALFTNMTYRFSDRFDLQGGLRQSWLRRFNVDSSATGTLASVRNPDAEANNRVTTYLVTPRYRFSPQAMIYGRFATGYRPGSINNAFAISDGAPESSEPDETINYEVGLKAEVMDGRVSIDAAAYFIDWSDVQISLQTAVSRFAYTTNGGTAKSQGVELSLATKPWHGLGLAGWVVYNNAVLTENLPPLSPVVGLEGDRLADSSRWSGNIRVEQAWRVSPNAELRLGSTVSLVDKRLDVFTASGIRKALPGYEKVDVHASWAAGNMLLSAFVTNVANTRGVIGFGEVTYLTNAETYIQPRTFGVRVRTRF
jgi:iron complex outermembrane recepter protein